MHIWHWLPSVTNTRHQLTEHKWARTGPSRTHSLQTGRAHMFHMLHCSVGWCITWNYDNSVIFMTPIFESGPAEPNCGVLAAAVTIIEVPLVLSHTHTCTLIRACAHTHTHLSFRLAHSHRLWASGFMECEQQFFFMCGLGKQYLEPADRYAIYYPVCWNTSHPPCLPVTRLERSKTGEWTRYWCVKYQRMHFFFFLKKRNRNACDHCPVVNAARCYLIFVFARGCCIGENLYFFKALCSIMGIEKSVSCIEVDKANVWLDPTFKKENIQSLKYPQFEQLNNLKHCQGIKTQSCDRLLIPISTGCKGGAKLTFF